MLKASCGHPCPPRKPAYVRLASGVYFEAVALQSKQASKSLLFTTGACSEAMALISKPVHVRIVAFCVPIMTPHHILKHGLVCDSIGETSVCLQRHMIARRLRHTTEDCVFVAGCVIVASLLKKTTNSSRYRRPVCLDHAGVRDLGTPDIRHRTFTGRRPQPSTQDVPCGGLLSDAARTDTRQVG